MEFTQIARHQQSRVSHLLLGSLFPQRGILASHNNQGLLLQTVLLFASLHSIRPVLLGNSVCYKENAIQFEPFQKLLDGKVTTTCIRMARDISICYVRSAALVFPALVGGYKALPTLGCSQNTLPHYTEPRFHPAPPQDASFSCEARRN